MTVPFREAYKTKSSIVEHPNYPTGFYRARGKRFLDLIIIFASLPFVLPMIALLVLVVARDGGQPFFTQKRVGRHGRTFRMVKLRSMVPDAEAQLQAYLEQNPQAREEWNRTQKLKSDPRITRVGRFLRRSSLDELPQLWNVLKGDVSLVGPRPPMPYYVDAYPELYGEVLKSRPGITGLATLRFHAHEEAILATCTTASATDRVYRRRCIHRKARLDLIYQARRTIWMDLRLIGETALNVVRPRRRRAKWSQKNRRPAARS